MVKLPSRAQRRRIRRALEEADAIPLLIAAGVTGCGVVKSLLMDEPGPAALMGFACVLALIIAGLGTHRALRP